MPLYLTGTWEQAILTAVAKAASDHSDTGFLDRTALQKIVYFLQLSGVPMRYQFDIYYYGPFCDRIPRDVEWLVADDVLLDTSLNSDKYSNFRPGISAEELLVSHAEKLQVHQATINRVVQSLLPFEPSHLELVAMIDYLYRQLKAGGGHGPWKERVIERFMVVKKEKFERPKVSDSYDTMVRANLIEV